MHPRTVVPEERFGHEGRGLAVATRDILDHVLVPHGPVGHDQKLVEEHGQFSLACGRHLVVENLDRDPDPLQGQRHLSAYIVLGVVG